MAILVKNVETRSFITWEDFGDRDSASMLDIVNFDSPADAERAIRVLEKSDEIAAKAAMRIEKETSRLGFWDREKYPTNNMLPR